MPPYILVLVILVTAALTATPSRHQPAMKPWAIAVEPVTSPAAAGSGQPQLSVSAGGVILSWMEQAGQTATLKFAERTTAGWSSARVVASGTDWFVNWADVPSVVRLAEAVDPDLATTSGARRRRAVDTAA
jgi:hypothetical protein